MKTITTILFFTLLAVITNGQTSVGLNTSYFESISNSTFTRLDSLGNESVTNEDMDYNFFYPISLEAHYIFKNNILLKGSVGFSRTRINYESNKSGGSFFTPSNGGSLIQGSIAAGYCFNIFLFDIGVNIGQIKINTLTKEISDNNFERRDGYLYTYVNPVISMGCKVFEHYIIKINGGLKIDYFYFGGSLNYLF